MARRQRDRGRGERLQDTIIEAVGTLAGGAAAGALDIPSPVIAGIEIDPGIIAGVGALGLGLSRLADRGIAAKGAVSLALGFGAGRMALRFAKKEG